MTEKLRPAETKTRPSRRPLKEMLFLAEQAAAEGFKVLPGKRWALHYAEEGAILADRLAGLRDGRYQPEEVADELRPDALVYDAADIEARGLPLVSAQVRNITSMVSQYDYERFARFAADFHGRDVDVPTIQTLYDGVMRSRIQKKMLDAYGSTGRGQMEMAMRQEAMSLGESIANLPRLQKILEALRLEWMYQDRGYISSGRYEETMAQLSDEDRELVTELRSAYRQFAESGDETAYEQLAQGLRARCGQLAEQPEQQSPSEEMQKLSEELEPYREQAVPPGTPGDPGIPPQDSDEYHTPPPSEQGPESKEKKEPTVFYEIRPSGSSTKPLTGSYCSGRKSYYDIETKTWSKRKSLTPYYARIDGDKRQTISGRFSSGTTSIPIPNGYALDMGSLRYQGIPPQILRDQNGCFYVNASGSGEFSIDFLPEPTPFVGRPVREDLEPICRGSLSQQTEALVSSLTGTPIEQATQIQHYIRSHHFYPGGGDLNDASALQYKLRSESTGDTYLQNIDQSEYLECYSANTLMVAMARKAGIPARLVVGHRVQSAKGGKAAITDATGHAWAEIWDGQSWRRVDATPPAKPEDKKKDNQETEQNQSGEEAEDGGLPTPDESSKQDGQQGKSMPNASDSEVSESESELQQAEQQINQSEAERSRISQQISQAQDFKQIQQLEQELRDSELLEDQREQLEQQLEDKQEQLKEELKDELEQMTDDGFMTEEQKERLEKMMEDAAADQLDRIAKEMERESRLYEEYEAIKEEVMPLVDQWFEYFIERLPRQRDLTTDEDSLTRQGSFNRHSAMRPRNIIFGTVRNPRVVTETAKPLFLASIMLDVSGSMSGEKLTNALRLLVFYCELFSRIEEHFGYVRFAINIFSDSVREVKQYDQSYTSPDRYVYSGGKRSTVKVRLMEAVKATGGTNMLDAIKKAAEALNRESEEYPDYASAFYFVGDGGDTCGNSDRIRQFLANLDGTQGFGGHFLSAIMLGSGSQRQELAAIFGDEHTSVAPDLESLIEESMHQFDDQIEEYLADKVA